MGSLHKYLDKSGLLTMMKGPLLVVLALLVASCQMKKYIIRTKEKSKSKVGGDYSYSKPSYSGPATQSYSKPSYSGPSTPSYSDAGSYSKPSYSGPSTPSYNKPSYSGPSTPSYNKPSYSGPSTPSYSN